jgi:hypothetical protein
MWWPKKAAIVALFSALLAFPATAQADPAISIRCDSHSLEVHVGYIDIHLSGNFDCYKQNRRD